MRRQLLDPIGALPNEAVVRRLCGVQSQVPSSADLAIRVRQESSAPGDVTDALAEGRLIRTWAMRGTIHLLTPEEGGDFLSLLAAGRSWERPSWQRAFGMTPRHLELLRVATREALDGRVLTREELVSAVTAQPGLDHLGEALRSGWGTLLKPLAWHGDLCFGPPRGGRATFTRPDVASARWAGIRGPDEAAPDAIAAYLAAYGPATEEGFSNWLSRGRIPRRTLRAWFGELGDRLAPIDVDGEAMYVLAEDLDEVVATEPTAAVRLVPGFDQYVLGPGTDDGRVVPPARRSAVSRQSGWVSPVVVAGGVVAGTWELDGDLLRVAWFGESGTSPTDALAEETARLSVILARPLELAVELAVDRV